MLKQSQSSKRATDVIDEYQRSAQDLERENVALRREMSELTRTYLQQVQQLGVYFGRIRQCYNDRVAQSRGNSVGEVDSGKMGELMGAYEKMMEQFGEERNKYVSKIEELAGYIDAVEERERRCEQQNRDLRLQLQIARQELKIYKRSKIIGTAK